MYKIHLRIRLTLAVMTDLYRYLKLKALQKIDQLVDGEAAEMPIHQARHVGLRNAQNIADRARRQLPVSENLDDLKSDLCPRQELISVFEAEVGEDIARALLEFDRPSFSRAHVPTPCVSAARFTGCISLCVGSHSNTASARGDFQSSS
jgi:hypothetical protein